MRNLWRIVQSIFARLIDGVEHWMMVNEPPLPPPIRAATVMERFPTSPVREPEKPMTIQEQIVATAQRYGVDPNLALAVARQESGFNQAAVSPVGAIGVFQLMPATAAWLGVDPYNVAQNIEGGVRYLSQLLRQYGNDVNRALAAYNWGPGNLAKAIASYGEQWITHLPAETKNYLARITRSLGTILPGGSSGPDAGTVALLLFGAILFFWAVS